MKPTIRPSQGGPLVPRVVSFIVLVGFLLIIGAIFFQVMAQFILPLFLAAVLVVVFKPLHMRVRERLPGRIRLSALVTTTTIMLIVLLPTAWLGWNAYLEGKNVFDYLKNRENQNKLIDKLESTAGPLLQLYESLGSEQIAESVDVTTAGGAPTSVPTDGGASGATVATPTTGATPSSKSTTPALKMFFGRTAAAIGGFLLDVVRGFLWLVIGLIIMIIALYYFLVDGPTMIRSIMRLSPLDNEYEQELLDKFANVSRAVVVAVLAAAVAQGLLAGMGYYFALNAGAPVFLLMAMTMIGAVVPFVGAAGVWIPTCLWIFFYQEHVVNGELMQGDSFAAIVLAIYCGCVVSTVDNVIKPLVLHGQSNIHPLLALMSVIGGIKALGPGGILIGPMVVAFIHALLVMVNRELRRMSGGNDDGSYQKHLFPLHPALEMEAEQAARESPGGVLEKLATAAATATRRGKPEGGSHQGGGAKSARASKLAKRRRGHK
jgi:predicted PurR-regulated permease PerM